MSSYRRVGVIGSTGQLGTDLVEVLEASGRYEVVPIPHDDMDVADRASVERVIGEGNFDVVVNCAAFHQVDQCEDRPDEAFRVNAHGAYEVARASAKASALCVYISTDYVFAGSKGTPYTEDDSPGPVNLYGVSKVAGELAVRQVEGRSLIVRVSSVFGKSGARGKGGNFIEAILGRARTGQPLRVVNDQWMTPTYTRDAATAIDALLQLEVTGTIHASNAGRCSWYDFAQAAVRLVGIGVAVEPIASDSYPSRAVRPHDSSLDTTRVAEVVGRPPRFWRDALRAYLTEKGYLSD